MSEIKTKNIKMNAFYSFLKAFLTLVFPLITFPYATRILQPEGIGKINFSLSIVTYFNFIAQLGVTGYATREASKIADDKDSLSKFAHEILLINFISTAISYILFLIVISTVSKLSDYVPLLLIFSTHIIFTTLSVDWLYNALEEFRYVTIRSFIFHCIALVYLFTFVKTKDDLIHYAIYGVITDVGSYIFNFIHSRKFIYYNKRYKLEIKKHLKFVFTFFGMSVVTSIYAILDSSMLGFLSNDIEVGYYSAAIKLNKMTIGLITSIFAVLLPRLALYFNKENKDDFNKLIDESLQLSSLISVPIVFGLASLAEPLILLFSGENYLPALIPMIILTPIIFVISLASITGTQLLPSINKEKISLLSYIIGAVTNVTLNILFIPKFGAIGAAIGTLAAETFVTSTQVIFLRKFVFTKSNTINFIQALIASVLMFIGVKIISSIINVLILQILISVICGILIYSLILFIFRNKLFISTIKKLLGKLKK